MTVCGVAAWYAGTENRLVQWGAASAAADGTAASSGSSKTSGRASSASSCGTGGPDPIFSGWSRSKLSFHRIPCLSLQKKKTASLHVSQLCHQELLAFSHASVSPLEYVSCFHMARQKKMNPINKKQVIYNFIAIPLSLLTCTSILSLCYRHAAAWLF